MTTLLSQGGGGGGGGRGGGGRGGQGGGGRVVVVASRQRTRGHLTRGGRPRVKSLFLFSKNRLLTRGLPWILEPGGGRVKSLLIHGGGAYLL